MVSQVSSISRYVTNDICFQFLFSSQIPEVGTSTTQKPFCFHQLTNLDGHLLNCLRLGYKVQVEHTPFTVARHMGLHSEEDMTLKFPATLHPIPVLTAILAIPTAHREDTATAPPSPKRSWQDHTTSDQTKQKHFTKQPECPDNEQIGFTSQLKLNQ